MPTAHVNGIDIWYEFRGDGPTLVLSHGWMSPTEIWLPEVVDGLTEKLRVLFYDVRGQGRTSAPDDSDAYSMAQCARDLAGVMDAAGLEQAHIGGVSQGGMISAQFAVDYPERTRSLILSDTTAGNGVDEGPGGAYERKVASGFPIMEEIARTEGLDVVLARRTEYDRANDPHYNDHPQSEALRAARDARRYEMMTVETYAGTMRAIRDREDLTGRLHELHMPALVLGGEWDEFYPCSERDHKLLAGSRFVRVRRCGHASPDWRPDAFVRAVTEFVLDVEAGREVAGELVL